MTAYYNEHQPHKAAWLRQLISDGHIAPGEVDKRNDMVDAMAYAMQGHKNTQSKGDSE